MIFEILAVILVALGIFLFASGTLGLIRLPDMPGFGRMVDWDKVNRLAP